MKKLISLIAVIPLLLQPALAIAETDDEHFMIGAEGIDEIVKQSDGEGPTPDEECREKYDFAADEKLGNVNLYRLRRCILNVKQQRLNNLKYRSDLRRRDVRTRERRAISTTQLRRRTGAMQQAILDQRRNVRRVTQEEVSAIRRRRSYNVQSIERQSLQTAQRLNRFRVRLESLSYRKETQDCLSLPTIQRRMCIIKNSRLGDLTVK